MTRPDIRIKKELVKDSGWRDTDIQPRYMPVYQKTRPNSPGWIWRSIEVTIGNKSEKYLIFIHCHPARENWKSCLLKIDSVGAKAVARFEQHATHTGFHAHASCFQKNSAYGTDSLNMNERYPNSGSFHRRHLIWSKEKFHDLVLKKFNVVNITQDLGL